MNINKVKEILSNTAYVRMGGNEQELKCANYICEVLLEMGLNANLAPFEVPFAKISKAELYIDGKAIPCKGYTLCGSHDLSAPLFYLRADDKYSLSNCKDKIVLLDGYLRHWAYQDIFNAGAKGIITYDGCVNYVDRDIDQRELRPAVANGNILPCVNINAKDAVDIINGDAKIAKIVIEQEEFKCNSHNVVLELMGNRDEFITFTAHYDTTSLSNGAYDNMSGCIGLIALAEYFSANPHDYSMRFIWCGSEERGLLGAKAYCNDNEEQLKNTALNINLDMIGCIMGKFIACCTCENALVNYISYLGDELGFQVKAYQDVYSSDSTPFADKGVPAVSFARLAGRETATIHNSYDTDKLLKPEQLLSDVEFITAFSNRMANAKRCPVSKEIPDNMKEKLDEYLLRKRKK